MKPVVVIKAGNGGWGGPLICSETDKRKVVASVTGGGIHPIAQKIADLLGVPAIDGFKNKVDPDTMIVVVTDCGGTLRCGVYPKLGVKTIDIHAISPAGPMVKFIKEDNFCSGVTEDTISVDENGASKSLVNAAASAASTNPTEMFDTIPKEQINEPAKKDVISAISGMGRSIGKVVNVFYQAGRNTVESVLKSILPFMIFVSIIVGIINYTGLGTILAHFVTPLAGSLPGMLVLSIFCAIPFLSPVLGPGAVIAQIIGVLLGTEIGKGVIRPSYALPALFAINSQVGCDFVPVALTLAEAEADTVNYGVPAMLFSRLVTGPIAVLIAYVCSFGLY